MNKFTEITSSTMSTVSVPRSLAPIGVRFQGRPVSVAGYVGGAPQLRGRHTNGTDPHLCHGAPLL
ncbi:hypothetical protein CSO01_02630 [Cellulomonas soli]|uniref:Uncharacterized protein n=1 Tax=Cellulomonas soli TaxID=931535 RepID=A0A512P8L9_9CELL|nr:hypothetical protein [Cellulomonas soli]GEP67548.1 hypothetical protein CSO01_02630 [Cellulomonas soli]